MEKLKKKLNLQLIGKNKELLNILISTILITILFHRQALGINLLLFESVFVIWILATKQIVLKGKNQLTFTISFLFSSISTIVTHSTFSYILNFTAFTIFIGILIYTDAKSLINTIKLAVVAIFKSQIQFLKMVSKAKFKGQKLGSYIWKSRIFIIPALIILVFVLLYKNSNPVFDKVIITISDFIGEKLNLVFQDFDFLIIITILISLFLSNFFLIRYSNKKIIKVDNESCEELKRHKRHKKRSFRIIALKNEYKAGLFLLLILNFILLVVNVIDIKWVWFNFEWEGQYLKQFVHEGTYLLILSIVISVVLVLYFFRGNINFFQNNKFLQILSYIWLAQNAILTLSVAIRNFRYINYFSLAYKRIGVVIFLLLTLYGLFTVLIKVYKKKTTFYLFKTNALAIFIVLLLCSSINWDSTIAKYNFRNSENGFLHLNYMATLSNKSLPFLDKSLPELKRIDKIQKEKFPFKHEYMQPEEFYYTIDRRKNEFKTEWESKNILSWNLPEYLAYKQLFR